MAERPIYLDIGIGRGGEYVQKDPSGSRRVGLDMNRFALRMLNMQYGVRSVSADASGEARLPFSSGSCDHIDVIFPLDELLYGLCHSPLLWQEFRRVLKANGDVAVVFDVPPEDFQASSVRGEEVMIFSPENKMMSLGGRNGFSVEMSDLSAEQTRAYGTNYARSMASWQSGDFPTNVYLLRAVKHNT